MLKKSVKFILPNCCELFDPDHLRHAHLDLVRLPFPLVALEAPWEVASAQVVIEGFQQSPATKRIALCWEADARWSGCRVSTRSWITFPAEVSSWSRCTGPRPWANGSFRSAVHSCPTTTRWPKSTRPAACRHRGSPSGPGRGRLGHRQQALRAEPFILLPEMFELAVRQHDSLEKAFAQVILDTRDEIFTLIQVCSVLHCANVTTAERAAPQALNKKRRAHDKEPFFSSKVLQLSEDRRPTGRHGPSDAASMTRSPDAPASRPPPTPGDPGDLGAPDHGQHRHRSRRGARGLRGACRMTLRRPLCPSQRGTTSCLAARH